MKIEKKIFPIKIDLRKFQFGFEFEIFEIINIYYLDTNIKKTEIFYFC